MKTISCILMAGVMLASCSQQSETIAPAPEAKIDERIPQELMLAVYDNYPVMNNSVNAVKYSWDLGNGEWTTTKDVTLHYTKSGVYQLMLAAANSEGTTRTDTRTINVYDYVIKRVTLKNLHINFYANSGHGPADVVFPVFNKVNMWMEIKLGDEGKQYTYTVGGDKDMPVLWKSPVVTFTDGDLTWFEFQIPDMTLNVPALGNRGGLGWGYGFNLYVQDSSGTYLIGSSYWAGSQSMINYDPGSNKTTFTMVTSPIVCDMDFHGAMVLPR